MGEGEDAAVDLAMAPKAYEWAWHSVTTVTFRQPKVSLSAKPNVNGEGRGCNWEDMANQTAVGGSEERKQGFDYLKCHLWR